MVTWKVIVTFGFRDLTPALRSALRRKVRQVEKKTVHETAGNEPAKHRPIKKIPR